MQRADGQPTEAIVSPIRLRESSVSIPRSFGIMKGLLHLSLALLLVFSGQNRAHAISWTKAGWAVVSGVLGVQAAQAWNRIEGNPTETDILDAVNDLAQRLRVEFDRNSAEMATSHYRNASRELRYYVNVPAERARLHDAEVESGYAMEEFKLICFTLNETFRPFA